MIQRAPRVLATIVVLACAGSAWAATRAAGVDGARLVLESRNGPNAVRRAELVLRDPAITKGAPAPRGAAPGLDATVEIFWTGDAGLVLGRWTLPAPWRQHRGDVARFANPAAPGGATTVRDLRVREGAFLQLRAHGLGDDAVLDLAAGGPAVGGVTTVVTLRNAHDGTTHRLCTRFESVRVTARRRATKLVARDGVAAPCPPDVVLTHGPECEPLNDVACLLPYPSSRFLVPASTPTGVRVEFPASGLPQTNGPPVPLEPFRRLDGFSPGSQILMHFPQGLDVLQSNVARLLPPQCCGQPAGPPWIDTRTYTDRSRDADSPSVLLDATTGERVLHFVENDARAAGSPRQLTFLRPAVILQPGHRYVVAMRHLVARDGTPVLAEPAFASLRDGIPTAVPAVEARRAAMEDVFAVLGAHGVAREDLVLAFDFTVGSEERLTRWVRSMRDQSFAWLDALDDDPQATNFTVTRVVESSCSASGAFVWRQVEGTYEVPLFLTDQPRGDNTPETALDANDQPVMNGTMPAAFTVTIPCSVLRGATPRTFVFGHGLGQLGSFMTQVIPGVVNTTVPWDAIGVATDWRGLSGQDLGWVATHIIGVGASQLHHFEALPSRLRQGMTNTLLLARMTKQGLWNRDPAFRTPDGRGVFPGPASEVNYYGISLGGIMGTYLAGLSPDIARFALDVPSVNFSCMLQRATPFASFDGLLASIGVTQPLEAALGIQLTHEFWASADPLSVIGRILDAPLPGSGDAKKVLYLEAWLDKQVSNQCTEIAARSMGLPNLVGSMRAGMPGIPDVAGPVDSAYVSWGLGELDILDPAHAPFIPPLANQIPSGVCDPHPRRPTVPAAILQLDAFTREGGAVRSFCDGVCDGATPIEQAGGGGAVCTPP